MNEETEKKEQLDAAADPMFAIPFCMHGNYLRGPQCPECAAMARESDLQRNPTERSKGEA
jgi:hypothetical protein